MRALGLVSRKSLRVLRREVTALVIKSAVSLHTLQQLFGKEVPGGRIAVLCLTDGTLPAPVVTTQSGETLAADGVAGPAQEDGRAAGEDETDGTLQLLLQVDISQLGIPTTSLFSGDFGWELHGFLDGVGNTCWWSQCPVLSWCLPGNCDHPG